MEPSSSHPDTGHPDTGHADTGHAETGHAETGPSHRALQHSTMLIHRLIRSGVLRDHHWRDALDRHPRHAFLRGFYDPVEPPHAWRYVPADSPKFLPTVHSGQALVAAISPLSTWGHQHAVSVSPPTDLQIVSLQTLDLFDGADVLEIGTGTGHTTALLCQRLDPTRVTSIEIDPDLHRHATRTLHGRDLHPALLLGDSAIRPLPIADPHGRGVFDRILVTHEIPTVPTAWIRLLRPGGIMLARISGGLGVGAHTVLRRPLSGERRLTGPFLPWTGALSPHRVPAGLRLDESHPGPDPTGDGQRPILTGSTPYPPEAITAPGTMATLVQLLLPPGTRAWRRSTGTSSATAAWATYLRARDGSWAEIAHAADRRGRYDTRCVGPTRLLAAIDRAHTVYNDLAAPPLTSFGVTADATGTVIWHDNPTTGVRWPILVPTNETLETS